ncbi:hypothetical protein [uncultured Methanoregula sp.]|uniref:hypothetical protein n=1 Tax=uncultured Methanoregula sp. TaxID=1005933 RepID=UPI002AAB611B|nr:hypothetical protein [uncultured Methanoregula sp.]
MQNYPDPVIQQKQAALAKFLGIPQESLRESSGSLYTFKAFFHGNDEAYLVLTNNEATIAAGHAVQEKLWLISLETLFAYFDIDAYPADVLGKMKTREIRRVNDELKALIYNTSGMDALKDKMFAFGNRKNLLADYDQMEYYQDGYFIYRLY